MFMLVIYISGIGCNVATEGEVCVGVECGHVFCLVLIGDIGGLGVLFTIYEHSKSYIIKALSIVFFFISEISC